MIKITKIYNAQHIKSVNYEEIYQVMGLSLDDWALLCLWHYYEYEYFTFTEHDKGIVDILFLYQQSFNATNTGASHFTLRLYQHI